MIPQKHRQLMALVGLLLVFVVILAFQLRTTEPPPAAATRAPSNNAGRAATTGTSPGVTSVTDVRLEALQRTGEGALETDRNPFRFRPKAAPPPPRAMERGPAAALAPQAPSGPPPLPPIPLRLIGVLETQPRLGVFSGGRVGEPPLYGKEGDIIDGRYRVLRIGPESADLSYIDGRGRQTLRMSGQ
jgi:hypothetical protein